MTRTRSTTDVIDEPMAKGGSTSSGDILRRIYRRAGSDRFYIDLREFGGGREALVEPGKHRATTDELVALDLAAKRVAELMTRRRERHFDGVVKTMTVGELARDWLAYKRGFAGDEGYTQLRTLRRYEQALAQLFDVMDQDQRVDRVTKRDVKQGLLALRRRDSRSGGKLSASSLRQVIAAMQLAFDYASDLGVVPEDYNPWRQLRKADRPRLPRGSSTDFLETYEGCALLDACDRVEGRTIPLRPIVATLLLTGGRKDEVLGLEIADIDLRRKTVRFRTNRWRRIKTGEERTIPLWPQLERELRAYLQRTGRISGLLFPSPESPGADKMITALSRPLAQLRTLAADALGAELGARLLTKAVTPRALRPTYCAARLQTVDGEKAIAIWTVRDEMGHSSLTMINRVYGRLGTVRHRSDVVEYLPIGGEPRLSNADGPRNSALAMRT